MKSFLTVSGLVTIMGLCSCDRSNESVGTYSGESITIDDLNRKSVVGDLGVPLGDIVVVEAIVVDGDTLRMKLHAGDYLLKIISVDGVCLEGEPLMEFGATPGSNLPADLQNVGSVVKLYAYESGRFSGIPSDNFPEGAMHWADTGFGFRAFLNVLCSADSKRDKGE